MPGPQHPVISSTFHSDMSKDLSSSLRAVIITCHLSWPFAMAASWLTNCLQSFQGWLHFVYTYKEHAEAHPPGWHFQIIHSLENEKAPEIVPDSWWGWVKVFKGVIVGFLPSTEIFTFWAHQTITPLPRAFQNLLYNSTKYSLSPAPLYIGVKKPLCKENGMG